VNVRPLLILLTIPLISGCSILSGLFGKDVEPIVIQKKANERTRLNLSELPPLTSRTPTWIIVTPDNVNSVWKDLKDKNTDVVLFALTDNGYEELALNIAELRNFINSQRQIIIKYKQYYEPTENKK